jgi:putative heme-binding domain-containing protein
MGLLFLALSLQAPPEEPVVRMLAPGFEVRELPVSLSNVNNVEYAPDGRLFASGYDGRVHLLRDADGDGLEEKVDTFHAKTSDDYSLGIAFRDGAVHLLRRHGVYRYRDTDGDGIPDVEELAVPVPRDPATEKDPLMTHRRVDDALGLAFGPDGSTWVTIGAANYANGHLVDKATTESKLDLKRRRGVLLRIPSGGGEPEIVATGVRFIVCLQFNREGDLFGADQEGATWLPNGNPFDEFLHLQPGRHYGFPPRHPKHLPDVIDEPSLVDYGPQHQSTCGFRFNSGFGPASWDGDALVTAMSRGKLYRTELAKTPAGYVARNSLAACIGMLAVDCAVSPKGDLVVACQSGAPDWGSGPKGAGKLLKIRLADRAVAQPLFAHAAGPGETAVVFDRPLAAADWQGLAKKSALEGGLYVAAGDRFERFRPGYQVVKNQQATPRKALSVFSAAISADGRSIVLQHPPRTEALNYAVTIPGSDLAHGLHGLEARWTSADGATSWSGWLPHADFAAARALTAGSAAHDRLWGLVATPGRLELRGQLDLNLMLRPAIQQGSKLDYEYAPETVTVEVGPEKLSAKTPGPWVPLKLSLATGPGVEVAVSWRTAEDPRPRALPLHRLLLPWARPAGAVEAVAATPEIEGGRWEEGRKLFFGDRAACGKCHAIRGEGGAVGPDLSNLVHRDYASVLKDVLEPSAAINPDHPAYVIRLKDGDVLSGVIVKSTPEALELATAKGDPVRVERARIERLEPSKLSIMPEGLLKALNSAELRDLMTFLLSTK